MFRVSSTHHQEYQKLYLRPLVHVIVLVPLPADSVAWSGLCVKYYRIPHGPLESVAFPVQRFSLYLEWKMNDLRNNAYW